MLTNLMSTYHTTAAFYVMKRTLSWENMG